MDRIGVKMSGVEIADLVGEQRAGQPGQKGADRKGQRLVSREVDAHALRRNLAVTNCDPGTPRRRAQQI